MREWVSLKVWQKWLQGHNYDDLTFLVQETNRVITNSVHLQNEIHEPVAIKKIKYFRGKLIAVQNSFIQKRDSLLLQENQQKVHQRGQPMMVGLKDRDDDPPDNGFYRKIVLWRFI